MLPFETTKENILLIITVYLTISFVVKAATGRHLAFLVFYLIYLIKDLFLGRSTIREPKNDKIIEFKQEVHSDGPFTWYVEKENKERLLYRPTNDFALVFYSFDSIKILFQSGEIIKEIPNVLGDLSIRSEIKKLVLKAIESKPIKKASEHHLSFKALKPKVSKNPVKSEDGKVILEVD